MATLIINDTKQFDQQVWQTETWFTQEQYNEWLKTASKKVQQLYDELDTDIPSDRLYILGDIINLLSAIKVDTEHRGESWTCTESDFDKYDLSDLNEEEINSLVDEVANCMGNNDYVADCYWETIEYVAEKHGLKEKKQDEYKHDDLVQFIKDNCHLKPWQIEQSWDYIGNHTPISPEVSDKIDVAITEFCIENDIDNDLVLSWEDAEDLFMECFNNN